MSRFIELLCRARRLLAPAFTAVLILSGDLAAQVLPPFEPYKVVILAFRPGSGNELLLGLYDQDFRLQAHLIRVGPDGKAMVQRTLPGSFTAVAYLDSGRIVTGDDKGKLQAWPAAGTAAPEDLAGMEAAITGIGVSPKSRTIAVRPLLGPLRFFSPNGKTNGPAISVGVHDPKNECGGEGIEKVAAFSADEKLIAFSGMCGELRVVGREGARLVRSDPQRPYVKRHAFAADGKTLLVTYTGQPGGGADFWPVAGGRLGNPRPLPGPTEHDDPADVAALPDNSGFVVLSKNRLRFLAVDGKLLRPDISLSTSKRVAVSDDGQRIAVAAEEGVVLFDRSGKRLVDRPFAEFGQPVATVATAGGKEFVSLSLEGRLRFWRLDGTSARPSIDLWNADTLAKDIYDRKGRLLVSPNGRFFAVHAPNGQFDVFDENWGRVGRPLRFPIDPNNSTRRNVHVLLDDRILRPLPDGSGLMVFGFDGRVIGRLAFATPADRDLRAAAAIGTMLATYNGEQQMRLRANDGKLLRERRIESRFPSDATVDLSLDGRTLVLRDEASWIDGSMTVWRIGERETLETHKGGFVRLLPDGQLVRYVKGRLIIDAPNGATRLNQAVDFDQIHAVTADATMALVTKDGVARLVKLTP